MIIGGLQKFSLLDYPEHLSAIVFTQGCNFRCQYCYNPMLVWPKGNGKRQDKSPQMLGEDIKQGYSPLEESDLFDFLKDRVGKLDAVVITGGEPTIHQDLPEFSKKIKETGFKIKLDTNGTNPAMIKKLIDNNLIDYIAMDIKAPENKYDLVTGVQPELNKIKKSIKIITESDLPYEFRTTVVPELIEIDDIRQMGEMVRGAQKWFLQAFQSDKDVLNERFKNYDPYSDQVMEKLCRLAAKYVRKCEIR